MKIQNNLDRLVRQFHVIYYHFLGIITFPIQFLFLSNLDIEVDTSFNRVDVINLIIKQNNFKSYLEIGCDLNKTFNNVIIQDKVGVDPIRGGTFRGTSDDFFSSNIKVFDLIFIDGSHLVEDVYRDLVNSLNCLKKGGIILFDDILPTKQIRTFRKRCTNKWNGDVYKIVKFIDKLEEASFHYLPYDHGMGLIKKNNEKVILFKNENFNDFSFKDYKKFVQNKSSFKKLLDSE